MKKLRLAFIGAGRVADVHYQTVQNLADRCELVAFCDVRPEAVASRGQEWGIPGYTGFSDLLDDISIDAAVILLPHDAHLENIRIAAEAGVPVFLEKPLAATLADADAIVTLVEGSDLLLFVAHNGLFHPAFDQLLNAVRQGWIGKPLFAKGTSAGWLNFREWDFRKSKAKTGGGCWLDAGSHLVYCLREVFGEVRDVRGFASNLARTEMEGEDHACVSMQYESGAMAQLFVSYGHKLPGYEHDWPQGYLNSIEVYGDAGAVQYVISPVPQLNFFSENTSVMPKEVRGWLSSQPALPYSFSFQAEMVHFLDCLEGMAVPRVTARDSREVLRTLFKLYAPS